MQVVVQNLHLRLRIACQTLCVSIIKQTGRFWLLLDRYLWRNYGSIDG
jgi:hypothetical protein